MVDYEMNSEKDTLIRNLIVYIVHNVNCVTEFSLVKLMYLIEVGYFIKHQKRLTDITYKFHLYGPYSDRIHETALGLDNNLIKVSMKTTKEGYEATIYDPLKKEVNIKLPKDIKEVADLVILEFGSLGDKMNEELRNFVYSTLPLTKSERGKEIDFNVLKPSYREDPALKKAKENLTKRILELSQ